MSRILSLVVALGAGAAWAQDGRDLRVRAVVVDQVCATDDRVEVTLTADSEALGDVVYQWDFDHDGEWDTEPDRDPTVTLGLPDGRRVGVTLGARDRDDARTRDRLAFETIDCR